MDRLDEKQWTRPAHVARLRAAHLPADIVQPREVAWLGELEQRLAAVEAWRGTSVRPQTMAHIGRPQNARGVGSAN
jgi:hypothetical protein